MPASTPKELRVYLTQLTTRYLSADSDVQLLRQREQAWRESVDAAVARHVRAVFYRDGRLTLHADSSLWLNKLSQQQQALIKRLRTHTAFTGLRELHVRVVPRSHAPTAQPASLQLTGSAAAVLESAAEAVHDGDLATALRSLAATAKR